MTKEWLLLIIGIVLLILVIYRYVRDKSIIQLRADVYKLFIYAERYFTEEKAGKQKMDYVVSMARGMLPACIQVFVSDKIIRDIFQLWFDDIKDLLDDGTLNESAHLGLDK